MQTSRIIKSGFKTAWTHKLRAILMILGIVTGTAALTVIISLGKGTEVKITSQVKKLFSSNTIMVGAGRARIEGRHVRGAGFQETSLKLADIEEIAGRIENIIEWDAVQIAPESEAKYNGKNTVVTISGHTPSGESVWNIAVTDGRFFSEAGQPRLFNARQIFGR
jgi:putative ABC transport system permease protein